MSSRPLHRKFHVSRNSTNLVGTSVLSSNFSGISFRACRFTSSHWPSNGVLRIPVFVFFLLLLSEPVPDFSRKLSCKHAGIDHRKGWLKALVLTSCPEFALSNVSYLKHITPSNICKCLKLSILLLRNIAYEMRLRHLFWIFFFCIPDCWWHLTLCKNPYVSVGRNWQQVLLVMHYKMQHIILLVRMLSKLTSVKSRAQLLSACLWGALTAVEIGCFRDPVEQHQNEVWWYKDLRWIWAENSGVRYILYIDRNSV